MREKGVLFSASMVRAILAGQKTVTRRVCKDVGLRCRYGQPGDRLWVRETWRLEPPGRGGRGTTIEYRANDAAQRVPVNVKGGDIDRWLAHRGYVYIDGHGFRCTEMRREQRWNPAIHMPRWASRITLDVVSVRVERLHDIDEADAAREGVDDDAAATAAYEACTECQRRDFDECVHYGGPREAFAALWSSINGPGSWDANPWVWRIEFRRAS